jgi:hypothetical protein
VGRISVLRILGFLLSNLDFTRIRCVQAHDFGSFLLVWEHSNPTIAKFLEEFNWKCHRARRGEAIYNTTIDDLLWWFDLEM